jgi:Fe-S cluster biogenesis protein NfuA
MFIQTQTTPNPNSLKFLPGKVVSNSGSYEIKKKDSINNNLIRNIFSISGVKSVFLGVDFISVNKEQNINWEEIKHIVISLINEHYQSGKKFVIDKDPHEREPEKNLIEIERQIIKILDTKIKPAVAKDGGNIKFKGFKDGIVKVELQGSCSGCPSSIMTLKQGIQNLLCHYIPDVKEVVAVPE